MRMRKKIALFIAVIWILSTVPLYAAEADVSSQDTVASSESASSGSAGEGADSGAGNQEDSAESASGGNAGESTDSGANSQTDRTEAADQEASAAEQAEAAAGDSAGTSEDGALVNESATGEDSAQTPADDTGTEITDAAHAIQPEQADQSSAGGLRGVLEDSGKVMTAIEADSTVMNVSMPLEVPFTINPFEMYGKGQIYSDVFQIENHGAGDVVIDITDIRYIFANEEDFVSMDAPVDDSVREPRKALYMLFDVLSDEAADGAQSTESGILAAASSVLATEDGLTDAGDGASKAGINSPVNNMQNKIPFLTNDLRPKDFVITDQAQKESRRFLLKGAKVDEEGDLIAVPSESAMQFTFSGSVNIMSDLVWADGDVKVSIVYSIRPATQEDYPIIQAPELMQETVSPDAIQMEDAAAGAGLPTEESDTDALSNGAEKAGGSAAPQDGAEGRIDETAAGVGGQTAGDTQQTSGSEADHSVQQTSGSETTESAQQTSGNETDSPADSGSVHSVEETSGSADLSESKAAAQDGSSQETRADSQTPSSGGSAGDAAADRSDGDTATGHSARDTAANEGVSAN